MITRRNLLISAGAVAPTMSLAETTSAKASTETTGEAVVPGCLLQILGSGASTMMHGATASRLANESRPFSDVFGQDVTQQVKDAVLRIAWTMGIHDSAKIPEFRANNWLSQKAYYKFNDEAGPPDQIVFSEGFVKAEVESFKRGGVSFYGYIAHELAHAVQKHRGLLSARNPDIKKLELQADYAAGWVLARDEEFSYSEADVAIFADRIFYRGDHFIESPDHHGMPSERFTMMVRGYLFGKSKTSAMMDECLEEANKEYSKFKSHEELLGAICHDKK